MLCPTRVEPGCLRCKLYEDVEDWAAFTLVQEWSTPADFERHLRSETYRRLLMLMELSVGPPEVRYHVISATMGMEAIYAVRGE